LNNVEKQIKLRSDFLIKNKNNFTKNNYNFKKYKQKKNEKNFFIYETQINENMMIIDQREKEILFLKNQIIKEYDNHKKDIQIEEQKQYLLKQKYKENVEINYNDLNFQIFKFKKHLKKYYLKIETIDDLLDMFNNPNFEFIKEKYLILFQKIEKHFEKNTTPENNIIMENNNDETSFFKYIKVNHGYRTYPIKKQRLCLEKSFVDKIKTSIMERNKNKNKDKNTNKNNQSNFSWKNLEFKEN